MSTLAKPPSRARTSPTLAHSHSLQQPPSAPASPTPSAAPQCCGRRPSQTRRRRTVRHPLVRAASAVARDHRRATQAVRSRGAREASGGSDAKLGRNRCQRAAERSCSGRQSASVECALRDRAAAITGLSAGSRACCRGYLRPLPSVRGRSQSLNESYKSRVRQSHANAVLTSSRQQPSRITSLRCYYANHM